MNEAMIFSPLLHQPLLSQFAAIHMSCITHDATLATFLPPLSQSKILAWWEARAAEVATKSRAILFVQASREDGVNDEQRVGLEVAGVVMLSLPPSETGPFRGVVEKLLVSPRYRRRGVAKFLMEKLEEVAKKEGRTMLLLDTEKGSSAEVVYSRLGWIKIGDVPRYGISPKDGRLVDEAFFYKDLLIP